MKSTPFSKNSFALSNEIANNVDSSLSRSISSVISSFFAKSGIESFLLDLN